MGKGGPRKHQKIKMSNPAPDAAPAASAAAAGAQPNGNDGNVTPNASAQSTSNSNNNNNDNNNNENQQRLRRIRIHPPHGGGVGSVRLNFNGRTVSINQGVGMPVVGGFGSTNMNDPRLLRPPHPMMNPRPGMPVGGPSPNNRPQHPQQPGLPRLEPQVLPDSQQRQEEQKHENEEKFGDFKCSICYDVMKDPSGCGKCSARFCFECLKKVAQSGATDNNNIRCPMCRSPFDSDDIQRDVSLRRRMEEAPPAPCRYQDCEELCPLTRISEHEASCPHVRVQCRYKPFGCAWTGKRGELSYHEENECYLSKVSGFVDMHRHMQAEYSHRFAHLHQNLAAMGGMLEAQRMRERQLICSSNIFHMAQFVLTITCCTPHFLLNRNDWTPFYLTARGRAKVLNCVSLIPIGVFLLKAISTSYQQFLWRASNKLDTEDKILDLIDAVLNFLITSCLAIIICLSFFVDGGSAETWKPLPLPNWWPHFLGGNGGSNGDATTGTEGTQKTTNVLEYGVTLAFASIFAVILEFYGSVVRAICLWFFMLATTTVFPALLNAMSELLNSPSPAANPPTVEKVISSGRAVKPLLFGIRYGPLAAAFGPLACVDAAILVHQGQAVIKRLSPNLVFEDGNLLSNVPAPFLYFYAGASLGLKVMSYEKSKDILDTVDFLMVAVLLMVTNLIAMDLIWKGIQLGAKILSYSRSRMTSDPTSGLRVDYNGIGMASLSIWLLLVAAIAVT